MNEIGFAIIGDGKYGGKEAHPGGEIPRKLHLHARSFSFTHPDTGRLVTVRADLPDHMMKSWDLFGFDHSSNDNPFLSSGVKGK